MIVSVYLNKNICYIVQHDETPDRVFYVGVVVNAGEMEGDGNADQMLSCLTLSNSGFP